MCDTFIALGSATLNGEVIFGKNSDRPYNEKQPIDIAIEIDFNKFSIIVTDKGKGFDISKIKTPDMKEYLAEMRVGGLGIFLMRSLMDEVDFNIKSDGINQVKMIKYFLKDEDM